MSKNIQSPKPAPIPITPPSTADGVRIPISGDTDIVKARQEGRKVAAEAGFAFTELALIATAISELARNIVRYARSGEIAIRSITNSTRRGIQIVAQDQGLGLRGVRRLMDEFDIQSGVGQGTTVSITKWRN